MMCSTKARCSSSSRCAAPKRMACWKRLVFIFRLRPDIRLSITFMPLNRARFWNVRAMPISATWREFMWPKVLPRKVMVPFWGVYTPLMQFSIELLPAPLGPMMARTSCSRTLKLMSVRALTPPKAREMPWTSRMTSPILRPSVLGLAPASVVVGVLMLRPPASRC